LEAKAQTDGRAGGILLHPTSLPGSYGCGEIGRSSLTWLDWLHAAGMRLWQMLPLGPTGYGDSPYQNLSAFAGNPLLIDIDALQRASYLEAGDLEQLPEWGAQVDFGLLIPWKMDLLNRAADRFLAQAERKHMQDYRAFCEVEAGWLDPYAVFVMIKDLQEGAPWTAWPDQLARRDTDALTQIVSEHRAAVERVKVLQYFFFQQWQQLHLAAHDRGITMIGDMPIFVAHDSSDVWARPDLFLLDEAGIPLVVAGVPPDYFSETGQRWGNPLYAWEAMRADGYSWWKARLQSVLKLVDIVRLDHFRGFEAYWEIPGDSDTAVNGRWVAGPGAELLDALAGKQASLPILAEDLGIITPEVDALRDRYGLPGMKVLQFGLEGGLTSPDLPPQYPENCAAYTGTHDNNTSRGWFEQAADDVKAFTLEYLACSPDQVVEAMLRAIWSSRADWAIAPLQDLLGLGEQARMNYPGTSTGNWTWRMDPGALTTELAVHLHQSNRVYDRLPA
jgi:4-alpha-glucanotransferase